MMGGSEGEKRVVAEQRMVVVVVVVVVMVESRRRTRLQKLTIEVVVARRLAILGLARGLRRRREPRRVDGHGRWGQTRQQPTGCG